MALKTNTRKVRENVRSYIMDHTTFENYDKADPETFVEAAKEIMYRFRKESTAKYRERNGEYSEFYNWTQGLPAIFDADYWLNPIAIDDLGDILEETETERNRFTEDEACDKLTYLIYRELKKGEEE